MPKLEIKNLNNEVVGELDLQDAVFAAKINKHLLYAAVRHWLAALRQGTHATKNRSEVSGGGKKPWRQKGTGRARVGSSRNPIWRHGGVAHGPQPRSYDYHFPKKMALGALRSALTEKFNGNAITVVDQFTLENHKTQAFQAALKKLGAEKKCLIVENGQNQNLDLASRNLAEVKLVASHEVNVYDLLNHDRVLFSRSAIEKLQEALS
jgi:large subunit ribosomal protein L4